MVARDVTPNVVVPSGVTLESLSAFAFDQRDGRAHVNLGSLVAEQVVQIDTT